MDSQMQAMIDKLQILQMLATYSRGIDRVDLDLLKSVYWEDGVDNHANYFRGNGWAFAEWVTDLLPKMFDTTCHLLGQTYFATLTETRATTETYFCASHGKGRAGHTDSGRYVDLFEKRGDAWRILKRDLILDLHAKQTYEIQPPDQIVGLRAPDDVSYEVMYPS